MRDSFVFYKSFADACRDLPADDFKEAILAIADYATTGEISDMGGIAKAVFLMAKPILDKNNQRYENGKKGGRPKSESKPSNNQTKTESKPNETEPEPYVSVSVSDSVDKEKPPKGGKEKEPKHRHGEHVLLTDKEYERLKNKYGDKETEEAISYLDKYITEKHYKSNSHNLTLQRWVFDAVEEQKQKRKKIEQNARSGTTKVSPFNKFEQRENNFDEIEAKMMNRGKAQ